MNLEIERYEGELLELRRSYRLLERAMEGSQSKIKGTE
jgi:hypothetical protein